MAKKPKVEIDSEYHSGSCAFCESSVPVKAVVCSGCGATWGFKNGMNRQELYDDNYSFVKVYGIVFKVLIFSIAYLLSVIVFDFDPGGLGILIMFVGFFCFSCLYVFYRNILFVQKKYEDSPQ